MSADDGPEPGGHDPVGRELVVPEREVDDVAPIEQAAAISPSPRSPASVSGRGRRYPSFIAAINRATAASTRTTAKTIAFALGMPVGLLLSSIVVAVAGLLVTVTAPMAFFWTVSITAAVAILFTRLRLFSVLRTEDDETARRALALYETSMEPLEAEADRMRARGRTEEQIEQALSLGSARQTALDLYHAEISTIRGLEALAPSAESSEDRKALGPPDST